MLEDSQHFDVLIVGGGLAGSSMAAALYQLPLSIAIVEATDQPLDQSPSFDDRALALSYGSLQILRAMGIIEKQLLTNTQQTIKRSIQQTAIEMIHVSDQGHSGFLRMHHDDVALDCLGVVVAAKDLGTAIADFISGTDKCAADISILKAATVESIQHLSDYASVQIFDAATNLHKTTVTAKLVILADGGRSPLNHKLGIATHKRDYQQVGILTNLQASVAHRQTAYERFTKNGPIALLPLRDKDFKLVWTISPEKKDHILSLPNDEFLNTIQQEFGDRAGEFERVGKRISYPMIESKTSQMTLGRVVLIGNSAHTLHPIAGQGFNLGLRDVACLAELVANAVTSNQDIADASLLASYVAERQTDIARTAKFTDSLVRIFSNGLLPLAAVRNASLFAIDRSPMLKREIMYKMMGLAGKNGKLLQGVPLVNEQELKLNVSASTSAAS